MTPTYGDSGDSTGPKSRCGAHPQNKNLTGSGAAHGQDGSKVEIVGRTQGLLDGVPARAMMSPMPTPPPSLSSRLRRRALLAGARHPRADPARRGDLLRRRPAGARALPRRAHRRRLRAHARADRRGPRAAVLLDRGRPALRALLAQRFCAPGPGSARPTSCSSRPAPSRRSACSPPCCSTRATPCSSRAPPTSPRCRASASRARGSCRSTATRTGLDPEALPALIAEHAPKFLYIVPTFQNPTGRTLPAARRARLAEIAAEHGLWILEDDPYGELRYDGAPLAPIGSHAAAADRTITISSLSKVLAPGLRHRLAARARDDPRPADDRQAGGRPAHLDRRPARRAHVAAGGRPRRCTSPACATSTAAAATRCSRGWAPRCRRARRSTGPTAGCSSGRGCPRAGTPRRCCARRSRRTWRSCRVLRSSPASPIRARCGCRSRRTCRRRSPRGWSACGARCRRCAP